MVIPERPCNDRVQSLKDSNRFVQVDKPFRNPCCDVVIIVGLLCKQGN